jgi:hypothetical protein
MDVAGRPGTAVLAAARGRELDAMWDNEACGLIVVIDHDAHGYRTIYCRLAALAVKPGEGQPGERGFVGVRGHGGRGLDDLADRLQRRSDRVEADPALRERRGPHVGKAPGTGRHRIARGRLAVLGLGALDELLEPRVASGRTA